ncbi:TauD/TfdA dioxygenase family protein [Sneathiella sp. HT1-7]|uniref:TauD/TfdA dioxygenase family protein n=1 Tax=Sneathiella sp. HT1-7 TaxID=2887192 RepID=UPI001D134EE7|nr:TauD/TfdA family dioxygenase [Sneathiella sp. HT1-7]MCC3304248.1 TauD/TfdA family dioxygenase [Sneathiella sp. HT1-7]
MNFNVKPVDATFGAVVTGLDLKSLGEADFSDLYANWLQYSLLIFPAQHLTTKQQVAFARRFGDMEFDLAPISNVDADGNLIKSNENDMVKILKGNMGWHQDSTYMPVQAKGAVFSAHVVPSEGGETGWADLTATYEALDQATRDLIQDMKAYHSLHYSQQKMGFTQKKKDSEYSGYGLHDLEPPLRPLVKTHPETGRPCLTIGRHAYGIPGLSEEKSEALLEELVDFTCQAPRIYHHHWEPGDVVIWDNRCLLHQATPWDMNQPRIMYHSRIAGDPKSELAPSQP